jgi:hypothetical protein
MPCPALACRIRTHAAAVGSYVDQAHERGSDCGPFERPATVCAPPTRFRGMDHRMDLPRRSREVHWRGRATNDSEDSNG